MNTQQKLCSKPSMSPACISPLKQFYVCMPMVWFLLLLEYVIIIVVVIVIVIVIVIID